MSSSTVRSSTAALLFLAASSGVWAQSVDHPLGQHPAVLQQQQARGIDPNTYLVGHPASPRVRAGHANHDHPAVTLARARQAGAATVVDANTFLVQPPASTRWTAGPAPETAVIAALR